MLLNCELKIQLTLSGCFLEGGGVGVFSSFFFFLLLLKAGGAFTSDDEQEPCFKQSNRKMLLRFEIRLNKQPIIDN